LSITQVSAHGIARSSKTDAIGRECNAEGVTYVPGLYPSPAMT
jgi:hypothetical protein